MLASFVPQKKKVFSEIVKVFIVGPEYVITQQEAGVIVFLSGWSMNWSFFYVVVLYTFSYGSIRRQTGLAKTCAWVVDDENQSPIFRANQKIS